MIRSLQKYVKIKLWKNRGRIKMLNLANSANKTRLSQIYAAFPISKAPNVR